MRQPTNECTLEGVNLGMSSDSRPGKRVLVVEDTADIRELLEEILRFEGYEVVSAEDGNGALEELQRAAFDLVLTDLMMPGMNGLDLLDELKKRIEHAPPVIAMSAFERFRDEACQRGAAAFFGKPVDIDVLLREVQRVMDEDPHS